MNTKRCSKCGIEKSLSDFYKDNRLTDNHRRDCKSCKDDYDKDRRNKNPELFKFKDAIHYKKYQKEIKLQQKTYRELNKIELSEKHKTYYLANKQNRKNYYLKNKEKINNQKRLRDKERKKVDINFRIRCNLGTRLSVAIRNNQKAGHTLELLGCSIDFLKNYLENKFKEGMNWKNYSVIWEIDHIIPCISFNLNNSEEQKKCFHYTNLRPLWIGDNRSKNIIRRENAK